MRCPNCGGQMGLEDAFCPYCNTPNAMAAQHRSDMDRYRREYERTQASVIEKASFMQRQGSWLAIVVALLVALVVGIALQARAWDIGYSIRENNVERDAAEHVAALDGYLEQGDYGKFFGYYNANDLSLRRDSSYQGLLRAAGAYVDIVQYVSGRHNANDYAFRPEFISSTCGYLAQDLQTIYSIEQEYSFDLERCLPADKRVYLEDMRERTAVMAKAYFGFTDEDVESIPDVSKQKLARMIEEGIAS